MVRAIPLKAWHVETLRAQGSLTYLTNSVTPDTLKILEQMPHSFTVIDDSRTPSAVLACCGIIEFWEGRGEAWAFFARSIGSRFVPLHRIVKNFLSIVPIRRIEATVDYDFVEGHRWIRMLGFECEIKRMEKYGVGGRDATKYVLLKENGIIVKKDKKKKEKK